MDRRYIYFEYFKPCFWKIIAKLVKAMWTKGIEYNSFEMYKEDIVWFSSFFLIYDWNSLKKSILLFHFIF